MRRPSALPVELAGLAGFSSAEARRLGVTKARLAASDLTTVFRGARLVASADPSFADRAAAFASRMSARQFLSHSTPARLNGVPLPPDIESDLRLHVSVCAGDARPRIRGVVGHVLEPARTGTLVVGGMRMTDAPTTWCQLASLIGLDDLVAAGDFMLTRQADGRGPVATLTMLSRAVDAHIGSPGVLRMREALPLLRPGPLSRRETLLRLRIVRAGLPEPVIGYPVPEAWHDGYEPTVDLAYPEHRVAIEYEGDHHREPQQFRKDVRRYERLQDVGWLVVRVTAVDLPDHPDASQTRELMKRIASRLRIRGWRG